MLRLRSATGATLPREIALLVKDTAREVDIFLNDTRTSSVSTSVVAIHSTLLLMTLVGTLYRVPHEIKVVNVNLQPIAVVTQHQGAKADIIRAFGWLRGFVNLRIRQFSLAGQPDIMRIRGAPFIQPQDLSFLLDNFDRMLQDVISARHEGRNSYVLHAITVGQTLNEIMTNPYTGTLVSPLISFDTYMVAKDVSCRFRLLKAQAVNAGMLQAIQLRKPGRIVIEDLKHHILRDIPLTSISMSLSDRHKAQAYLAKGISLSILAHMLVRKDRLAVKSVVPNTADPTDRLPGTYLGHDIRRTQLVMQGPGDPMQVSSDKWAFTFTGKYFALASDMFKQPYKARAMEMAEQTIAQAAIRRRTTVQIPTPPAVLARHQSPNTRWLGQLRRSIEWSHAF